MPLSDGVDLLDGPALFAAVAISTSSRGMLAVRCYVTIEDLIGRVERYLSALIQPECFRAKHSREVHVMSCDQKGFIAVLLLLKNLLIFVSKMPVHCRKSLIQQKYLRIEMPESGKGQPRSHSCG